MPTLADVLHKSLEGEPVRRMSDRIGADEASTQKAVRAGVPLLFRALQNNASKPGGAEAILEALRKQHDGSVLGDVGSVVRGEHDQEGEGILRHVLGENRPQAEQAISKFAGMDAGKVAQLLIMLAPLIMGVLGKMKGQGQVPEQPSRLPKILRREEQTTGGGGGLGGGIGDILGDILKGRGTGQSPSGGGGGAGCLSMLGPLLRGMGGK